MARPLLRTYRIKATLEAQSPVHVGSADEIHFVDMPFAMNGQGQYYIPGTSMAGVLRAWMQQYLLNAELEDANFSVSQEWLNRFWGFQTAPDQQPHPSSEAENHPEGAASWCCVEDAVVKGAVDVETLHGLKINPQMGVAEHQFKFDRQILPKGTRFDWEWQIDLPLENSEPQCEPSGFERILGLTLKAFSSGKINVGASSTSGLGRITLIDVDTKVVEIHW